jgi:hypothetical protein
MIHVYVSPLSISFSDFFFVLLFLVRLFILYILCLLMGFTLSMRFVLLFIKKSNMRAWSGDVKNMSVQVVTVSGYCL